MNALIHAGRKLITWSRKLAPRYDEEGFLPFIQRKIAYNVLNPVGRCVREAGRQKYLHEPDASSAAREIRSILFRKLEIYVEGYLANVSHRFLDDAPNPMPADQKTREKWGYRTLLHLAEECDGKCVPEDEDLKYTHHGDDGDYEELARIYHWMKWEYPNWHNYYWEKAPAPTIEQGKGITFASEKAKERFDHYTDRAERLDWIIEERIRGREQRLFERRHLLRYD